MPLFTKDKDVTKIENSIAGGDVIGGNKTTNHTITNNITIINAPVDTAIEVQNTLSEEKLVSLLWKISQKIYTESNRAEGRLLTFAETEYNIHIPDIKNEVSGSSQSLHDSILNHSKNYSLTGCGGAGKTFMIFDCIKRLLKVQEQIIPFYIPLHSFNETVENTTELLIHYLFSQFSSHDSEQFKLWLQEERNNNTPYPLLFLDGFNEITNQELEEKIVAEVRNFQRCYPRIRFVISSRYDLSSKFTASGSGELCFEQCAVKELSDRYINRYIRCILSEKLKYDDERINSHLNNIDNRYRKVLSTPMALAMHVKLLLNENFNLKIPNINPKTTGELIENFITLLQRSPDTEDFRKNSENEFINSNLILQYIGYQMNLDGLFEIEQRIINDYFYKINNELGISIEFDDFKNFPTVKAVMVFPPISNKTGKVKFIHQNFRDYYCAAFLRDILTDAHNFNDINFARKYIICYFRDHLPKEILVLLGDILHEYQYIQKQNDTSFSLLNTILTECFSDIRDDENVNVTISQLIEIAQIARDNNLNNFDFSGLSLSKTQLNNIKLYDPNNFNTAVFKSTYLTDYTFRANGHAGAIFTMAFVGDTYLISFSRGSVWCYDIEQRIHYQVHSYSNNAARASVHLPDKKMIITGDDSGCLIIWKYEINNNIFFIEEYQKFESYKAKIQNMVYVKEKSICFFVLQNSEAYFFNPTAIKEPQKFYSGDIRTQKMCAITADKCYVYIACGKKIISIKIDDAITNEVCTNDSPAVFCCHLDKPIDYIFDMTTRKAKNKTVLYLSGNSNETAGTNGFSEIYYTVLAKNGLSEKSHFNSVIGSNKQWINGFNGYNNFSLRYGDEQILYVCVYLTNSSIPNVYEIETTTDFNTVTAVRLVDCYIGKHEMSVECAIPLNLPNTNAGIATAAIDRTIEIIDLKTETIFARLPGYFDGVHMMGFWNNTLYTATYNGSISAWEYDDEDEKWYCNHVYPVHTQNAWVWEVKHIIHQGILYIISCSYDNTFVIFQPDTEEVICKVTKEDTNKTGSINDGKVFSVIPLSNGDILAACGKAIKWFRIDYNNRRSECIDTFDFEVEVRFLQKNQDNDTLTAILASKSIHEIQIDYRTKTISCPIIKNFEKNLVFRTTDSIVMRNGSFLTVYGGSNDKEKTAYFEVYISDVCTDIVLGEEAIGCRKTYGICSLSLYRYNEKILLLTASYSGNVSVYEITDSGKVICHACLSHYDQALDVMAYEDNLYCSTLDGKVFCWSLQKLLEKTEEKVNYYKAKDYEVEIFQTSAGFMMNHVDFSEAQCELSEKYRCLIEQYHTFFDKE